MKNVLIISSSPRKGGNSDLLCDQFQKGAQSAGHQTEKIFLADKKINYCIGCGACQPDCSGCDSCSSETRNPCAQKDDVAEILEKMVAADVIVLATPVYFYSMSAQLKTLIDRTCPRYTEMTNKEFYFIVTAWDPDRNAMQRTLESLRGFSDDCLEGSQEKGILYGVNAMEKGAVKQLPVFQEAFDIGRSI